MDKHKAVIKDGLPHGHSYHQLPKCYATIYPSAYFFAAILSHVRWSKLCEMPSGGALVFLQLATRPQTWNYIILVQFISMTSYCKLITVSTVVISQSFLLMLRVNPVVLFMQLSHSNLTD